MMWVLRALKYEDNVPLTEKETKGMFIDILPELPPDEGVAKVSFYLDDDDQVEETLRRVEEGLDELELHMQTWEPVPSNRRRRRRRTRTGSTTGSSILSLSHVDDILIKPYLGRRSGRT